MDRLPLHGIMFVALLVASAALAQNNRSAVSLNGSDLNLCTTASPCRSFGTAMTHTNAEGEIIALDSAGYGPFIIDKTVTVSGAPGVYAALSVTSGIGINVSASASDRVLIRNLVVIGSGGDTGIDVISAGESRLIGCLVSGFTSVGINNRSGNIVIDHASVIDNPRYGINLANNNPLVTAHATVIDSILRGNDYGVIVQQYTAVVVNNSTISGNAHGAAALSTVGTAAVNAQLTLERCTVAGNGDGVFASASGGNNAAIVHLSQNVIAYNQNGVRKVGNGLVYSFANNRFVGNGSDGGPFNGAAFQ